MRTTVLNSAFVRACMILSPLVCVGALSAADSAPRRASLQERVAAYAEAGLGDPCSVGRATPAGGDTQSSESVVPLAKLLSRTRNQLQAANAKTGAGAPLSDDLWGSRITIPQGEAEAENSLALMRLIRQVRSVKFAALEPAPTFTAPAESQPDLQTPETQVIRTGPIQSITATQTTGVPGTHESAASLSSEARQTLNVLQQNPGRAQDPLDIAELLFLSGRPAEAAPFYTKALDQISRVDPSYDADRAWVLFQLGNCLRETDIARAQEVYMKLVSEYPSSPWTELAKAHGRLLTWYQKSRTERQASASQL